MKNCDQSREFEALVRRVHAGLITCNAFFIASRSTWERLAVYLLRRWKAPAWVERDEVVQELMLAAWGAIWQYDPTRREKTIGQYVEWNAIDKAKKKLHKMRNAKLSGNADANPGRHEKIFSAFAETSTEWIDGLVRIEAPQEQAMLDSEALDRAQAACATERERLVIRVLAEHGDLVEAAIQLYEDAGARMTLGLQGAAETGRFVVDTARAVSARVEAA